MKMEGETRLMKNFTEWRFSQYPKYILLPIDENCDQVIRPNITDIVYSEVTPQPLEHNLRLVCYSEDALVNILDLDTEICNRLEFVEFIAGKKLPYGALPVAHRYGGHQYGVWVGQLGDGRAHILGEYVNRLGQRWQIQLKGSGLTPYSRVYDGRATLRACIREMIASESCYHLGIPTTRAAALVASDDLINRDIHYNGHPRREKASILLRLSPSWFRYGSLEVLSKSDELPVLKQLVDFIIKEYYPDIPLQDENRFIRFFSDVAHKSLDLVSQWQGKTVRKRFTHGLLNTDNMSLLGLTIDFGPFGFVDSYDGGFIANS
ncbi:unnamed protein product [Leptidea sinapis]|uniref:Selenoprotein O n=1 Tax=Leptidea sinapis TaxID=189913 RepID=A0A5E4QI77_9NEOP|nr:unnamed protein product [Leptidea sinapis]